RGGAAQKTRQGFSSIPSTFSSPRRRVAARTSLSFHSLAYTNARWPGRVATSHDPSLYSLTGRSETVRTHESVRNSRQARTRASRLLPSSRVGATLRHRHSQHLAR